MNACESREPVMAGVPDPRRFPLGFVEKLLQCDRYPQAWRYTPEELKEFCFAACKEYCGNEDVPPVHFVSYVVRELYRIARWCADRRMQPHHRHEAEILADIEQKAVDLSEALIARHTSDVDAWPLSPVGDPHAHWGVWRRRLAILLILAAIVLLFLL